MKVDCKFLVRTPAGGYERLSVDLPDKDAKLLEDMFKYADEVSLLDSERRIIRFVIDGEVYDLDLLQLEENMKRARLN